MIQSKYIDWIQGYLEGVVIATTDELNGDENAPNYLHRSMLTKTYSVTGKWESVFTSNALVMADVVAMDSSLPLKRRDSFGRASGDITKIGMKMWLNETQLTEINMLIRQGGKPAEIRAKLLTDARKCVGGVYERLEEMFLKGLSTGVTLVEPLDNVGTGVRLDYGYLASNKFTSTTPWSGGGATPFSDLLPLFEAASVAGKTPNIAYTDRATLNNIIKSAEAKEMYAYSMGFNTGNVPNPTVSQLNTAIQDRYGFQFQMVDRNVTKEIDGVRTNYKPWKAGMVVFTNSTNVGNLVWADLAEMTTRDAALEYATAEEFILVSRGAMSEPSLSEHTKSQARVVPVISNVDAIYTIDTTITAG